MNPTKTFSSAQALEAYPSNVLPANRNTVVYYSDSTSQLVNYANASSSVTELTAKLALATAIKEGIAAAQGITA